MRLSYVIITYNRRERLIATLEHVLSHTPLADSSYEIWVVDNASTDGTADAIGQQFGKRVQLIRLPHNEGMAARNHALRQASGEYVTILDDDSYPVDQAVTRSMRYMDVHPRTAAVAGRVVLPSGRCEASALPGVMIGCATTIRRAALERVGYFAPEFFRQAEEYDLSFRLVAAGYRVDRFEDLIYRHEKHAAGRSSALTVRMDLRNNLILTQRYLPPPLRKIYADDWAQRYTAIARSQGLARVSRRAQWEARLWSMRTSLTGRHTLDDDAIEQVFALDRQVEAVTRFAREHRIRNVVIGDLGKNIYATWRACHEVGLQIDAIADNSPAFGGLTYREIGVRTDAVAMSTKPQAIILSNINPAHVEARAEQLQQFGLPVLTLWSPRTLGGMIRDLSADVAAANLSDADLDLLREHDHAA